MTIMMPHAAVQSMPGATSRIISLPDPSICTHAQTHRIHYLWHTSDEAVLSPAGTLTLRDARQ